MKFIFAILFLCLVAKNAANIDHPLDNIENNINKVKVDIAQVHKQAAATLKYHVNKFYLDRVKSIEIAVKNIETSRTANDTCVAAEDAQIVSTVAAMHKSMKACVAAADNISKEIMADINVTAQQIASGGSNLTRLSQNFNHSPFVIIQHSFYNRFKRQVSLYFKNARNSINKIIDITAHRISCVVVDTDHCTHDAFEEASLDLNRINNTVNDCIAKPKLK